MKRSTCARRCVSKLLASCILLLASCTLLVLLPAAAGHAAVFQPIQIIFLHHSCGHNLIEQGHVREGLTALGYEFCDHGYNGDGLRLADGSYTGDNFDVPGDNTDPDGFAEVFGQPLHDPPDNTFSHLMLYDVIAFKSCYPASNIGDDYQLTEYQSYYLAIRDRMDQYPDKIFVVVTQPPQVPAESNPAEGARAHAFANWLQSDEYLAGHPNVFVFDFFGHLAGDDNFLRPEYRVDEYDGHPNERANRDTGPLFVAFVDEAIRSYDAGAPHPTPPPAEATQSPAAIAPTSPPPESTPPSPVTPLPTMGLIDDFESAAGHWDTSAEVGSTIECVPDTGMAHGGAASLHISYSFAPGGWADCGRPFESPQDWRSGEGLSLWLRSDGTAQWVTLMLFAGDANEPTPFEVDVEITPESATGWGQFSFPWASFARAEWADEGGLTEMDPARVTGYGFSLGAGETSSEGTLWVDDVHLFAPGEEPVEEPIKEPVEAEESGGGICPGAAVALPLGMASLLLADRRRR